VATVGKPRNPVPPDVAADHAKKCEVYRAG